jgi:hypothetical protein
MSELGINTGIETRGEDINWRPFKVKNEDFTLSTLMKQASFNKNIDTKIVYDEIFDINDYIIQFNLVAEKIGKFKFTIEEKKVESENIKNKKNKKIEKKKAELIVEKNKENDKKKKLNDFLNTLGITKENMPICNKKYIESFFSIIIWALHLKNQYKKYQKNTFSNKIIDISIYINCCISLYRAIKDSDSFLTNIIKNESYEILNDLENIAMKYSNLTIYDILNDNSLLIIKSYWDDINPKSIQLYEEQKETNRIVLENINKKVIIFVESPPGTGKTVNSVILAREIREHNKVLTKININHRKKILLYVCYNQLVTSNVAINCNSIGIDVKYWFALTKVDPVNNEIIHILRPHMANYPDWNQKNKRSTKEDAKYNASKWKKWSNLKDQMEFFMNETRRICEQTNELEDYLNAENLPEMIISDLETAYELLKEFPDLFITFFDEAFACASEEITAKIMSVMGTTLLVSATLAKPSEISTVIENFKERHSHTDYSFIYEIKSSKQHISCTFINSKGYIVTPHDNIDDINTFIQFIPSLEEPLIRRSYSPEVLFEISKTIDSELCNELKFRNKFPYIGNLNHESIRDYSCDILTYIANTSNENLFNLIKNIKIKKINDMDINKIFTENAIHYQNGNTLHVSLSDKFDNHIENISNVFLDGSPKIKNILSNYEKKYNALQSEIKSLEKNGNKESEFERTQLNQELSNLKYEWSNLYVMNSMAHANRFGNKLLLKNENLISYPTKEELNELDEVRSKLLFSNIGVFQPAAFNNLEMNSFMNRIDKLKFILSTPEIVYGTNIALSIIDIDERFAQYCTKEILYQLIGRAGRKGKSSSAMIIFRDDKMIQIILNKTSRNIAAEQLEHNFSLLNK